MLPSSNRIIIAAATIAFLWPVSASAAIRQFNGTQQNDTPPPAPSPLCGGGIRVAFSPATAITTGTSNFGAFQSSQAHCLSGPPGTPYTGGQFSYDFAAGDGFFGTYSGVFVPSGTENLLNNTINLVITGGTGRFAGATGQLQGVGTLDRRVPRPLSNLVVSGTLDLPAVPEPATWAMMIGGLGLAGSVARRRRTSVSLA